MYDKRIQGLIAGGFVRRKDGLLALAPKGARAAALFASIRRFLRLGPP